MKTTLTMVLAGMLLSGAMSCAKDTPEKAVNLKAQEHCPIMGGEINKNLFVDHAGQRIYVCCGGCINAVKEDFDGAVKKLAAKGEKPATLQTRCPVMKKNKVNKDLFVDSDGKRVYVCCKGCIATVKANPAKYIKQLKDAGITLADTPKAKEAK